MRLALGALVAAFLLSSCLAPGVSLPAEVSFSDFTGAWERVSCPRRSEWHPLPEWIRIHLSAPRTLTVTAPPHVPGTEVGGVVLEIRDVGGEATVERERDELGATHTSRTRAFLRGRSVVRQEVTRSRLAWLPWRKAETVELALQDGGLLVSIRGGDGETACRYRREPEPRQAAPGAPPAPRPTP